MTHEALVKICYTFKYDRSFQCKILYFYPRQMPKEALLEGKMKKLQNQKNN
jgi:hypothetical protein